MTEYQNKFSAVIVEYIQQRASIKLEALDKAQEKELQKTEPDSAEYIALQFEQKQKRVLLEENYRIATWLETASQQIASGKIMVATHAPKYSHSGIKGASSFRVDTAERCNKSEYLISEAIDKLEIDFVCHNAADLYLAGFLSISVDKTFLHQEIAKDNLAPFLPFAENKEQAQEWLLGFKQALEPSEIASHALAKQAYFPVDGADKAGDGYHLLSPLFSTSLYQQVHDKLEYALYSDEQKAAREARRKDEHSDIATIAYPDMAIQNFGGTKPQNISQLNTKRYGKAYLLNCAPPKWERQLTLPVASKHAFWNIYSDRAWRKALFLRNYLESKLQRTSTVEIRNYRAQLVDELIDLLIATAAEIQNSKKQLGWSLTSKIPEAEQLWLDPQRCANDPEFRQKRKDNDWQTDIAEAFGRWLNKRLRLGKKLNVDDGEYNEWRRLVEKKLRLLREDLEDFA